MNRKQAIAALLGWVASLFVKPKAAEAKAIPPVGVAVGLSFMFEGRRYGLAVPIMRREDEARYNELPVMRASIDDVKFYRTMLDDLVTSHDKTLQMLKDGTYTPNP